MAWGTITADDESFPAVWEGYQPIVEVKKHIYDTATSKHTWPGDWVADSNMRATRASWKSDIDPNEATIELDGVRAQDWEDYIKPIDEVRIKLRTYEDEIIRDPLDPDYGETRAIIVDRIIFRGWPTSVLISGSGDSESVTLTCQGQRYFWNRIAITGQQVYGKTTIGGDVEFTSNYKLIFNEGGRMNRLTGNGAADLAAGKGGPFGTGRSTDQKSYLFTHPANEGFSSEWENHDFWRLGDAVEYLINRFEDPDDVVIGRLDAEHKDFVALKEIRLPEIDVDGMTLTQALTEVFSSVGYHWMAKPNLNTGAFEAWWWKPGTRRDDDGNLIDGKNLGVTSVYFPAVGTNLSDVKVRQSANRFSVNYDYKSIINSYKGRGDSERYEDDWTLSKGWDASTESGDAANKKRYYRSGTGTEANPHWETYKNTYRRWVLDGSGLITGTARDFAATLGGSYMQRPRNLADKALSKDGDEGLRLPAEFFIYDDSTWKRIDGNVYVLGEGLADGIYIDGRRLKLDGAEANDLWDIMKDVTSVKIISHIPSDYTVARTKEDSASKQKYLTRQASIRDEAYKYEKRWSNGYGSTEVIRDDGTKLEEFLSEKLEATKDPVLSVSLTLPNLNWTLRPGMLVKQIEGRDIIFGTVTDTDEGQRIVGGSEIISVDMMLDPSQETQLSLSDTRLRRGV